MSSTVTIRLDPPLVSQVEHRLYRGALVVRRRSTKSRNDWPTFTPHDVTQVTSWFYRKHPASLLGCVQFLLNVLGFNVYICTVSVKRIQGDMYMYLLWCLSRRLCETIDLVNCCAAYCTLYFITLLFYEVCVVLSLFLSLFLSLSLSFSLSLSPSLWLILSFVFGCTASFLKLRFCESVGHRSQCDGPPFGGGKCPEQLRAEVANQWIVETRLT